LITIYKYNEEASDTDRIMGRSCFTLAWPREASLYPPGQAIMPVFQAW